MMQCQRTLVHLCPSSSTCACSRFAAGLVWETPQGARAPVDALRVIAEFMAANKVKRCYILLRLAYCFPVAAVIREVFA